MSLTELWPISIPIYPFAERPGHIVQLVTCLTSDPGVACSISARSYALVEIDHEMISMAILLPSTDLRRVDVSYFSA